MRSIQFDVAIFTRVWTDRQNLRSKQERIPPERRILVVKFCNTVCVTRNGHAKNLESASCTSMVGERGKLRCGHVPCRDGPLILDYRTYLTCTLRHDRSDAKRRRVLLCHDVRHSSNNCACCIITWATGKVWSPYGINLYS